jgi:hypothetical protein
LKHQPASRAAGLLQAFWNARIPNETLAQNQVRFTYDDTTNTLFVQAAPADMAEIAEMVRFIDGDNNNAINELRVVPLRNAISDDMANLLATALKGIVFQSTLAPGVIPGAGAVAAPPAAAAFAPTAAGALPTQGGGVGPNKYSTIRFRSGTQPGAVMEASVLEDIHIYSEPRTNSLLISAQEKTMAMLLALIRELDVPPNFAAQVRVIQLRRADAITVANIVQQMLLGTATGAKAATGATGTTGTTAQLPRPLGFGGAPGARSSRCGSPSTTAPTASSSPAARMTWTWSQPSLPSWSCRRRRCRCGAPKSSSSTTPRRPTRPPH